MTEEQGQYGRYPTYRGSHDRDLPAARSFVPVDDVSLFDLWEMLRRRRLTIVLVFLAVALGTATYGLSREPVYAVTSLIEIGEIVEAEGDVAPVESPQTVVARIEDVVIPAVRESRPGTDERPPSVDVELVNASGGLIRLSAEIAQSRIDPMQSFLGSVNDRLMEQLERKRTDRLDWFEARLADLQARLEAMDAPAERMDMDAPFESPGDRSGVAVVLRDVVSLALGREQQKDRWELEDRVAALELAAVQIKPTQIQRQPSVSDDPLGTGANLVIALGVGLGLILGVFAAFIREFLANARAYRDQSPASQT